MRRNPLQTRNFTASDVAPIEERFSLQAFVVKEYSLDGESKSPGMGEPIKIKVR